MITPEMMSAMATGKLPSFILTSMGAVQLLTQGNLGPGLFVATTREAAKKMAAWIKEKTGLRVAVAEVGTVTGEKLSMQIALAVLDQGATGVFATDDGQTMYFFQAPVPE
jgi:hypothetical protein